MDLGTSEKLVVNLTRYGYATARCREWRSKLNYSKSIIREREMSLRFVDDLQAQVERLEKEILKAEAAGKDTGGDRIALSHLKELIQHLRRGEKNSTET